MKHFLVFPAVIAIACSAYAGKPTSGQALIDKYSCAFDNFADEVKLMQSYLAEKDAVAGIRLTDGSRADRMRAMVDSFIAPDYLKRNRLLPNSSKMDSLDRAQVKNS